VEHLIPVGLLAAMGFVEQPRNEGATFVGIQALGALLGVLVQVPVVKLIFFDGDVYGMGPREREDGARRVKKASVEGNLMGFDTFSVCQIA